MKNELILVDINDKIVGYGDKIPTHKAGALHRAFSLFIYDSKSKMMLIQQRAINKYHSGGLWTNACCSHPRKNEKTIDAVLRRTNEELGITIPQEDVEKNNLQEIGVFHYLKDFGGCIENEIDHVFIWITLKEDISSTPNKEEIESLKWISIVDLEEWMSNQPEIFTAWFSKAYTIFEKAIAN